MHTTSAAALVRREAERAQQLFESLVRLHTVMTANDDFDPHRDLAKLTGDARLLGQRLALLRSIFPKPAGEHPTARHDCPDQLPLWHDAPANLED